MLLVDIKALSDMHSPDGSSSKGVFALGRYYPHAGIVGIGIGAMPGLACHKEIFLKKESR